MTDSFIHTGVITYKWICRSFFIQSSLGYVMKLTKWHNFVVCDLLRFAWGETLQNSTNFWQNCTFRISRNRETCTLSNYFILLISCFASNIISIEDKKMIYRLICKWWPPCVRTSPLWNVSCSRILRPSSLDNHDENNPDQHN